MTADERGVSEVLSYILTFALIIGAISFVLSNGLGAVASTQTNARIDAAQSGVAVLDKSIETLYQSGPPRRSTELKPNGGKLSVGGRFGVNVNISNSSTTVFRYNAVSGRFTHSVDDRSVSLALGARFRTGPSGVGMTDPPPFLFTEERTTVPLILLTGQDSLSTGSPIQVVATSNAEKLLGHRTASSGTPYTVEMTITTTAERAAAWKRYFERRGLTAVDGDPSDGEVIYSYETRRVIVQQFTTRLELQ